VVLHSVLCFFQADPPAASWVTKVGAGSCNFLEDSCTILTGYVGAQSFSFALNCHKMGDFQAQILYFWKKFSDNKKTFSQAKITGACHIATELEPF